MAGIYLHIPFCRRACSYCDFHFSTSLKMKPDFIQALLKEIDMRKNFIEGEVRSIYFGGGTPSLLSGNELDRIFEKLYRDFRISSSAEITLEANPEDLVPEKILEYRRSPVNRLSIGIQSFSNSDLKYMNRQHDAARALASVKDAQEAGFSNISVDLIYGTPGLSNEQWLKNLDTVAKMNVQHLSCYALTVEEGTPLAAGIIRGKALPVNEEQSAEHFGILQNWSAQNNFIQYEVSNFCKRGCESKHNSSYWTGAVYAGFGPGAHSFNGTERSWNISNNARYIAAISRGEILNEKEILSEAQQFNEYIMTSLRTINGCDLKIVHDRFGSGAADYLKNQAAEFLQKNKMEEKNGHLIISKDSLFLADGIASDLFMI